MNKQTLHHLHQLLDNALYLAMTDKMPDHMKGVQEALVLIKAEINDESDKVTITQDQFDYAYDEAMSLMDCDSNFKTILMKEIFE